MHAACPKHQNDELLVLLKTIEKYMNCLLLPQNFQDWISKNDSTDTNYFSIGCSVLFLNWLKFQLNFTWTQIIAAGSPTLAGTYKNLTNETDGYSKFTALINAKYPPGVPSNLTTDNPFPL